MTRILMNKPGELRIVLVQCSPSQAGLAKSVAARALAEMGCSVNVYGGKDNILQEVIRKPGWDVTHGPEVNVYAEES